MTIKIQHKRSAVKGKAPLPTDLEYGEIAVNYEAGDPAFYIKDSANVIRRIGNQPGALVFKGSLAPTAPAPTAPEAGHVYVMSAPGTMAASWIGMAGKAVVQSENIAWDGTEWESLGDTHVDPPTIATTSDTAPANPKDGDLWYDSVSGELYCFYDSDDAGAVAGTWVQANPQPTPKQATASVAGVDVKLWKKTGTTLETETAGDVISISAGTAALPGLTPVGDPNTGIYSPGADQLAISTNGTEKARITSDGQLLMGTATPLNPTALPGSINVSQGCHTLATGGYKFTVNAKDIGGLVYDYGGAGTLVAMNLGTDGTGGGNGVGLSKSATSWSAYSDERMKADLEPIADGLEKVATLRAVTGRYKTDEVGTSRSFLIAQDVQAVLPEAVSGTTDDDDQLSLRYTEVIPLLVAALKEAKDKIEQLQTRITTLEARP